MRRDSLLALIFVLTLTSLGLAQGWKRHKFEEAPRVLEEPVTFLSERPRIDGKLDDHLQSLPVRRFTTAYSAGLDTIQPMSYRIAYGTHFFYLCVEVKAPSLAFNDRAYQNGDGFYMLLAKAEPNGEPTEEFYELACSAVNNPALEWTRRIFWNYNVDKLFVPTSDETQLEFQEGNGFVSFELLLPWGDVRPYHPWISREIGFNLAFTKGMEGDWKIRSVVVDDPAGGAEFKKRLYAVLRFEPPQVSGEPQTYVSFPEGHIQEGDSLSAVAVTAARGPGREFLTLRIDAGEGKHVARQQADYAYDKGLTKKEFMVASNRIPEGGYMVRWESRERNSRGGSGVSILKPFDKKVLGERLAKLRTHASVENFSTTQFMIQELSQKLEALKPYETCVAERFTASALLDVINSLERGVDPFEGKTGFLRKAYRSVIDSSLQPYVVYLPENLDRAKKYPLFVFLHGSASSETNIQGFRALIPDGFIAVGPRGRGPSNGFSRDHAQDDIAEAIKAVEREYPIDSNRIVLAGFSMGGYGVYRTFFETPSRYRALAVFAGGPSMGARYASDANPPDFKNEKNLAPFRGVPIFIFHGEKDMNVPIGDTRILAEILKRQGARVELCIESDRGHTAPSAAGLNSYRNWINHLFSKKQ